MKTDHLGDPFHRLGFCSGCSQLKRSIGDSGLVFIANRNIISFIYNTAAQAVCKHTQTECKAPTVIYTFLTEEEGGEVRKRDKGREEKNYMEKLG